jgi:hypothetical protein
MSSEEIKMPDLVTGDVTWQVMFETSLHRFTGRASGFSEAHGASWDDLAETAKVMASRAKTKVSVPYAYIGWDGGREQLRPGPPYGDRRAVIRTGTATGIHAANGNLLIVPAGGRPAQLDRYAHEHFMPPTVEDGLRMTELTGAIRDMKRELDELTGRYAFDGGLRSQVQREIEKARETGHEDEARRARAGGDGS